jgi:hypothetical protein
MKHIFFPQIVYNSLSGRLECCLELGKRRGVSEATLTTTEDRRSQTAQSASALYTRISPVPHNIDFLKQISKYYLLSHYYFIHSFNFTLESH